MQSRTEPGAQHFCCSGLGAGEEKGPTQSHPAPVCSPDGARRNPGTLHQLPHLPSRVTTPRGRHTPRKRGIQYAAASRLYRQRLWNTGSPAGACHRAARRADPVAGDDSRKCSAPRARLEGYRLAPPENHFAKCACAARLPALAIWMARCPDISTA
jgi:hypothetical protein